VSTQYEGGGGGAPHGCVPRPQTAASRRAPPPLRAGAAAERRRAPAAAEIDASAQPGLFDFTIVNADLVPLPPPGSGGSARAPRAANNPRGLLAGGLLRAPQACAAVGAPTRRGRRAAAAQHRAGGAGHARGDSALAPLGGVCARGAGLWQGHAVRQARRAVLHRARAGCRSARGAEPGAGARRPYRAGALHSRYGAVGLQSRYRAVAPRRYETVHLSAGDLLRAEKASGSPEAALINACGPEPPASTSNLYREPASGR